MFLALIIALGGVSQATTQLQTSIGIKQFGSPFGQWINTGTDIELALVLNRNKIRSVAYLSHSLHNGLYPDQQVIFGCTQTETCIQGDSLMRSLGGRAEMYVLPRISAGAGGFVTQIPLLMDADAYQSDVVEDYWNGNSAKAHQGIHYGGQMTATYWIPRKLVDMGVTINAGVLTGFAPFYGVQLTFANKRTVQN